MNKSLLIGAGAMISRGGCVVLQPSSAPDRRAIRTRSSVASPERSSVACSGTKVGGGSGRDLTTVAGAAVGDYAATTSKRACSAATPNARPCAGVHRVCYRLGGKSGTVRLTHDPGVRTPVRNGQWVLGALSAGGGAG